MRRLVLFAILCWSLLPGVAAAGTFQVRLTPDAAGDDWLACDVCFLPADTALPLKRGTEMGNRYYATLPVTAASRLESLLPVAERAVQSGFSGFLVDPYAGAMPAPDPAPAGLWTDGDWGSLLKGLRGKFPDRKIILRTSAELPGALRSLVDGYLVEGVRHTVNTQTNTYEPTSRSLSAQRESLIKTGAAVGQEMYVREYTPPGFPQAAELHRDLTALGAGVSVAVGPSTSDAALQMPLAEVPRTVLCLYGFPRTDKNRAPLWPPDAFVSQALQMALEYLGYDMEFHDVGSGRTPARLDRRYAAILTDSRLEFPFADEEFYIDWLLMHQRRGLKLIFCGDYPGRTTETHRRLAAALGIRGSMEEIKGAKEPKFEVMKEPAVDRKITFLKTNGLMSAQAPQGASVFLSVSATDLRGIRLRCDPIYTTTWGGVLLNPWLLFETSSEDVRTVVDPFEFLAQILQPDPCPIPDATTRQGLRMFLSHIDGDGFTTLTRIQAGTTCAEIVRDRVLKEYPLPVTVSVIEAEVCGLLKELSPADRPRYEKIAQSILELNNVQGASHAYSHPYVWIPEDLDYVGSYPRLNLEFRDPAAYPKIDLTREIKGSVEYITKNLMPPGKKVETFLWSGNCRPSGEALRMVQQLGMEALNGGNTMINRRAEGVTAISARDTWMDGELQIYAPVQNEFVYTAGFSGPLFGGFRDVIDTFQRTETPRRLKPVNVYYHFYSVQPPDGYKAIREIHDWCLAQPLHSVTCYQFAKIARDTRRTRLYAAGPRRWVAINDGICRTFRVPAKMGPPNIVASKGVTGYRNDGDSIYVSTDGQPRVILDFTPQDPALRRPYLISSSGAIEFSSLNAGRVAATVRDLRPVQVVLGGLTPGASYSAVEKGGKESLLKVDNQGIAKHEFPAETEFSIILLAK